MKRITVLLAEDHQIVREGFRALLEHESDIEVVGEAANGRQAVQLTRKLRPAVVVMDIAMPLLNGLEAARQIRKEIPDTKVLFLSAHSDDAYVEQVTVLGATGFLLKQSSSENLATAIREVKKGNKFFQPLHFQARAGSFSEGAAARREIQAENQPLEFTRGRGAPADRRRQAQQTSRGGTGCELQNRGQTSPASHELARHPRRRRSHPLRHQRGHHRKQCSVDHRLDRKFIGSLRSLTFLVMSGFAGLPRECLFGP